ncbi:MAG: AmmeMemoRadiSam system protein A [Betaproteobacteria bacterium]|nr:AmmeMemoRadiSam system protein A [Betaproteobacteria bacterium]MDE1981884.1 AmmeMemoRadiSam system protein A [Betaproteobacteria bacterium]MDE2622672.1 AmmeMemoRadiSam system protein A [Betaproteobacteria bacterium]
MNARKEILQAIARAAIGQVLGGRDAADESAPWLAEPGASFVTLTRAGRLRGCIGTLEAHQRLLLDVRQNACGAAFRDPRFPALSQRELADTDIHVSVLTPLQPMSFRNEADVLARLRPGVDGLVLEFSHHRATFLPQVWEQLPQPHHFLTQLKRKAGLPEDFWAEDIRLSRYEVH